MITQDLVAMIESIYQVDVDQHEWLRGVATRARQLFGGNDLGAYALTYDASDVNDCRFGPLVDVSIRDEEMLHILTHDSPAAFRDSPRDVEAVFRRTPYGPGGALPLTDAARKLLEREALLGVEILGLNGINVDGRGLHVGVLMPAPIRGANPELMARVSSHLAAGYRLRARVAPGSSPHTAEAILGPGGKIEHAAGSARLREARDALALAAARIDELRAGTCKDHPELAIARWKALVDARWSLVDHFERDGKRYLLAQRNDPAIAPIALLSKRERQVVALAAVGHSDKMIAYELGISGSTARVLLSRASRKLGVRTRTELMRIYAIQGLRSDRSETGSSS